jgi:hypothetical protein
MGQKPGLMADDRASLTAEKKTVPPIEEPSTSTLVTDGTRTNQRHELTCRDGSPGASLYVVFDLFIPPAGG